MASELMAARQGMMKVSYKLDGVQSQMGDLQKQLTGLEESMNRMEILVQRLVSSNLWQTGELKNLQDLGQPGDLDREMARRVDDLRQIVATGWEQDQLPNVSTPEGNFHSPSTGFSVVATGWDLDPLQPKDPRKLPEVVHLGDLEIPEIKDYQPRRVPGKEILEQEVYGIDPYTHNLPKEIMPADIDWSIDDKQVRHLSGFGNTLMVYPLKPVIEEIQKYDLAQLYVVGRADKRLRCTGLFWKLPPWPDFCALSGDSFAQHCGYEVIENFYSVKQNNYNILDYTVKFEELIKIWSIMNEDYYARVEGWEIISNLSTAGFATMIAAMRPDPDNIDEFVRNTIARAFSVMASAVGISVLMPFLKVVCQSKKFGQARHTSIKIVQQIAILMGCADLPHLKSIVEIIEHDLSEVNQKVKTITALSLAALAGTAASYGLESFDMVLKPLWKVIRSHLGKDLAAYLINEKLSKDEIKLTPLKLFELAASIRNGTIKGKISKEILDELIAKGGTVKSMMKEGGLVQIADPADIWNSCQFAMSNGLPVLNNQSVPLSGHEYLEDVIDTGARELELREFLLSVMKEVKDKLIRPNQTQHGDLRVERKMPTPHLIHGNGRIDMNKAFPHLMQGNTRVDMNTVSTAQTGIHTFDLVNVYLMEIQVSMNALGSISDVLKPRRGNLFEEMQRSGTLLDNIIALRKCVMQTWLPASNALFEMFLNGMTKDGVMLDCTTYTILVHGYSSSGQLAEVVTTYGILLHGYVIEGAPVDMHALLDLMAQNGISLHHHIFYIMISAYGKYETVDKAIHIFNKMWQQRLDPDIVIYATIIDALCRVGRVDDAMFQFNLMIDEGLTPDIIVFSTLVNGLCTCDQWEEAEELAFEMMNRGIQSNAVFFKTMMGNLPGLNRRKSISYVSSCLSMTTLTSIPSEEEQKYLLKEIDRLLLFQRGVTSCKLLFGLLRTAIILKASPSCVSNLERRISLQLDKATLEDLLIPNISESVETLYDVDCAHRILDHFSAMDQETGGAFPGLGEDGQLLASPSLMPITMVAKLLDGYLAEVAPDVVSYGIMMNG